MGALMTLPLRHALLSVPALAAIALLAGCGGVEGRVATGLINAGLSEPMARCMAKPMARDLSVPQLRRLSALGGVGKVDVRNTTYTELLRKMRALNDPEIVRVTTSAAVSCAFGI